VLPNVPVKVLFLLVGAEIVGAGVPETTVQSPVDGLLIAAAARLVLESPQTTWSGPALAADAPSLTVIVTWSELAVQGAFVDVH
jgi:hypothetical protein